MLSYLITLKNCFYTYLKCQITRGLGKENEIPKYEPFTIIKHDYKT